MNWTSEAFKILSKFFVGFGSGFSGVMGFAATIDPATITLYNMVIFPSLSGMIVVFPQLSKTFLEASRK